METLSEARRVLACAAGSATAPVSTRVGAGRAQARAETLAGDDQSALAAMEAAVGLLPRIASQELRRQDREYRLGEVAGISAQAAATALSAGRPGRAVELLEQARGLLLAEITDTRGDLPRLRKNA